MSQIFLLTGENLYEIALARTQWTHGFRQKHGEENLLLLDAKSVSFASLINEVSVAPFIAEKRLVILSGIPKLEKGQIDHMTEAMHPDVLLLIVEPKPDKRLTTTKELLAAADVKTFGLLKGERLKTWLMQKATGCGSTLSQEHAKHLLAVVGEDQMLLASEIEKLSAAALGESITKDHIDTLCVLSEQQVAWKLMDLLAEGSTDDAIAFAKQLIDKGESPHGLWNQVLWIVSQINVVSAAVLSGKTSPAQVAKLGVPFPTAKTLIPFVRNMSERDLLRIVEIFVDADLALKTGGYRATAEAPDELHGLIDTCIGSLRAS